MFGRIKNKKTVLMLAAIGILAVMGIGMTLALLSVKTEPVNNKFMMLGSDDLKAVIVEKSWDPKNAEKVVPNLVIPKDPAVKNLNPEEGEPEYVALKITLTDGDGNMLGEADYTRLSRWLVIRYDENAVSTQLNPQWVLQGQAGNGAVYVYNEVVSPQATSNEIFKEVKLKKETINSELNWIKNTLNGFNIRIEGAAVQSTGVTLEEAQTELLELLNS